MIITRTRATPHTRTHAPQMYMCEQKEEAVYRSREREPLGKGYTRNYVLPVETQAKV